jgi:radical SAM protein with 4Fe4S-binding SPASM domain
MSCHIRLDQPEFSTEDVARTIDSRGLLAIEVELGSRRGDLGAEEARAVVAQAGALGARTLILRGGEPMLHPQVLPLMRHAREHELRAEVVTDGRCIGRETARALFELGARVVLERSSLAAELQDRLTGVEGAHTAVESAYRSLREAGYPSADRVLGLSFLIGRQNQSEIDELWEWLRAEGLAPYLEVVLPQDPLARDRYALAPRELQRTLERLASWDREHGGAGWDPQPPLVDKRCRRPLVSCVVDGAGRVLPCAGLRIPVGDLRERSLRGILDDSEVLENLRDHRRTIAGPCASCPHSDGCSGCRGAAYAVTGDYLASDPSCWLNRDRQREIEAMPLAAAPLLPQHEPMRLVDTLRSVGERVATAGVTVRPGMPFLDAEGVLSEAAYLEMMAQATAAMGGYARRGRAGGREEGLMLGTRDLVILGQARIGDELEIEVFKSARLGEFGIVEGRVRRQAEVLARGEIKVLQLGSRAVS